MGGSGGFHISADALRWVFPYGHLGSQPEEELNIAISWGDSGCRSAIHPMSIHRIDRDAVTRRDVRGNQPYFVWTILLNWPDGGRIRFGAAGFRQRLRGDRIETDRHYLTAATRR